MGNKTKNDGLAKRRHTREGGYDVSNYLKRVDSRFHGNDEKTLFETFCEVVKK